jgi:hypothetical protein
MEYLTDVVVRVSRAALGFVVGFVAMIWLAWP